MTPLETLLSIGLAGAADAPYVAQIELAEHQSLLFDVPKEASTEALAELAKAFANPSVRALISLSVLLGPDRTVISIRTASIVGFASVQFGGEAIFVRVRPKVPSRRFLELAAIAGRLPPWKAVVPVGHDDVSTMIEWTARAFVSSMESLVSRSGIRATHMLDRGVLRSRLRGKLLVSPFISNLAKGRPDRIPCEYSALLLDNKYNRVLRWSVHLADLIAVALDLGDLRPALTQLRVRLESVSLAKPTRRDVDQTASLPPNLRHYEDALRVARLLINEAQLDATAGATPAVSVALDMNTLYEDAFWALFKRAEPRAVRKPSWLFRLADHATGKSQKTLRFEPDILVPSTAAQRPIIIDTKWKEALRSGTESIDVPAYLASVVRPRTADLYQAMAYAMTLMRDAGLRECVAVLAYPCLKPVPDISHHLDIGNVSVTVLLIGWDISSDLDEGMSALRKRLIGLATIPQTETTELVG